MQREEGLRQIAQYRGCFQLVTGEYRTSPSSSSHGLAFSKVPPSPVPPALPGSAWSPPGLRWAAPGVPSPGTPGPRRTGGRTRSGSSAGGGRDRMTMAVAKFAARSKCCPRRRRWKVTMMTRQAIATKPSPILIGPSCQLKRKHRFRSEAVSHPLGRFSLCSVFLIPMPESLFSSSSSSSTSGICFSSSRFPFMPPLLCGNARGGGVGKREGKEVVSRRTDRVASAASQTNCIFLPLLPLSCLPNISYGKSGSSSVPFSV